ncbi:MAG: type II/IV secretion system protein [Sedimentisphaerales bacterium]|nr:type II/IV secretion system protein [Sedimentisphaerales bacterium]
MTESESQYPFSDLTHYTLSKEIIRQLDEDFCRENQLVLLGDMSPTGHDPVPLGMLDPSDDRSASCVERKVSRQIRRIQLNAFELDNALAFGFGDGIDVSGSTMILDIGRGRHYLNSANTIEFTRDQPVAKMVIDTFSEAVKRHASDIHIEVYADDVDVRFRIDGVLHQVATPFSKANIKKVCSHIKILAELDITEKRRAQEGRICSVYEDESGNVRQIDMRLSVVPGLHGSDMVLRLLDENRINISLDKLGLNNTAFTQFNEIITSPGGLIIVAGPTASGKTTTLYSAIRQLNNDNNKILTVEDPIEYEIPKVNQKQVNSYMSFADYSRAFMRQNPDILMIGEVRDEETANIAMRAAQMGHLVFTTLHSRDVRSSLDRLHVLCNDRSLIASSLMGILSQRLVRRICVDCQESVDPDPVILQKLSLRSSGISTVHGKGCSTCHGIGYKGQIGVFELLVFDDYLRREVWQGHALDLKEITNFRPMFDDAIQKVRDGITTLDEVLRTIPLPDNS